MHQIGNGVLGPVFRTYEPHRDRLVSVKVFRLDLVPEQAKALAEALQGLVEIGLEHPAIVTPLAAGMEGHTVYLAEEYVAAESLDIALRHYAPAPLETALPYLGQLAGAIDYARARGVGHGALHPRDIFLTPDMARATGFGITQALERLGVRPPVRRPYTAPERVAGRSWSTAADVFALGAVAHELLTGKRPAGTGEVARIAGKAAESHPELLRGVLARALADDPAARYSTASALVSALEAAARGEGEDEPAPRELAIELDAEALSADAQVEPEEAWTYELDRGEPAAPDRAEVREPSLFDLMPAAAEPELEPEPELELAPEPEPEPDEEEPAPLREPVQPPARPAILPFAIVGIVAVLGGFLAGYVVGSRERATPPPVAQQSAPPAAAATPTPTPATPVPSQQAWSAARVEPSPAPAPVVKAPVPAAPGPKAPAAKAPAARAPSASRTRPRTAPSTRRAVPAPTGAGTLVVESRPPGARVVLDGRAVGKTPFKLGNVKAGSHTVRLEMDGYRVWSTDVTVVAGRDTRVTGSLERVRNP